ncbi:MAG: hypothetical protein IJS63_06955 [Bacteroidaceae bacterium]|nr:hypothetical protein [Bacteroidaceae bacterium]
MQQLHRQVRLLRRAAGRQHVCIFYTDPTPDGILPIDDGQQTTVNRQATLDGRRESQRTTRQPPSTTSAAAA